MRNHLDEHINCEESIDGIVHVTWKVAQMHHTLCQRPRHRWSELHGVWTTLMWDTDRQATCLECIARER